jgi:mRNA interferase RelE/StbE
VSGRIQSEGQPGLALRVARPRVPESVPEDCVGALAGRPVRRRTRALERAAPTLAGRRKSGYNVARMPYRVVLAPQAVEDLRRLPAATRATVRDALEVHLRHEPARTSRSRIKRLRGLARPQYRIRVGETRVFYDVKDTTVEVLAVVPKSEAESWLRQFGKAP